LARAGSGDFSRVPNFIVGMQRSGATLLEQIPASHSGVFGTSEIDEFDKSVMQLPGARTRFHASGRQAAGTRRSHQQKSAGRFSTMT